jgi:Na+/melibiose symporter-like transporter
MPLAMAALPLYVHLPKFYGEHLGVGLTALGVLLLVLRLVDAVIDPLLGAWSDRGPARKTLLAAAAPALAVGIVALFMPPVTAEGPLLVWLGSALAVVYVAFSLATINHNAWGAELSSDPVERTRITAVREGLALAGVVVASVAPGLLGADGGETAGLPRAALAFAVVRAGMRRIHRHVRAGGTAWRGARGPDTVLRHRRSARRPAVPALARRVHAERHRFRDPGYADPVLRRRRAAGGGRQGLFLALYFMAGAAGMPLWVRVSARIGKVRAWHAGMLTAVVAFVWAARLGPGDIIPFAVICAISGAALGADLALPPSLLADVIGRGGRMHATGSYFGLWTLATKLNLALAAGIGLPLIAVLGYTPGARGSGALTALAITYAAVPSVLKLCAATALFWFDRLWSRR